MDRRRFLVALTGLSGLAGCSTGAGGSPRPTGAPNRITTTGGAGIEFLVAKLAIRVDAPWSDGLLSAAEHGSSGGDPRGRNRPPHRGRGRHSAVAHVRVSAGEALTIRYPVVSDDELTGTERRPLDQGAGIDFDVLVNGRERTEV